MFRKLLGLLTDAVTYGVSSLIGQALSFLLLPLFTRYLDKEQYGVIGMLTIISLVFLPMSNIGMTNAIFRCFARCKDDETRRKVLGTGLTSVICSSLVLLALSVLAAQPLADWIVGAGDPATVELVRLTLLAAAIGTIGTVPRVILRAGRRVRLAAMLNLAQVVFTTLPMIWFVVVQQQGVRGAVLGTLVGDVLTACSAFACTWGSLRPAFDWPTWKEMLAYGLPFMPHHLQAILLALFGQYVVREMLGLGDAGLYVVAVKFAVPVSFVVTAVQTSWVAYKFQIHADDDNPQAFFRSSFTYYVAGLSYLWIGVCLWGPEMVRLMTAESFHDAARLVWAVSLIPVAQGIYAMTGTGIELSNNTRPFPLISLSGLVTVVVAAFALVPNIGALGAALATVLGWSVMAVVMYYFAQRRYAIAYDWPTIGCFAVASAAFAGASYVVQDAPLSVRLLCAIMLSLAYPVAGFLLLLRSRVERGRMLHLLSKFRLTPSSI